MRGGQVVILAVVVEHHFEVFVVMDELLTQPSLCLLYTSDAADDMQCVDLGGRRIIKKKV